MQACSNARRTDGKKPRLVNANYRKSSEGLRLDAHDAHHPAGTELSRSLDCGMDPPSGGSGTLLVSKNRGPAWSVQPGLERPSHRETTVLWAARGPDGYARARHRLRRRLFLFRG